MQKLVFVIRGGRGIQVREYELLPTDVLPGEELWSASRIERIASATQLARSKREVEKRRMSTYVKKADRGKGKRRRYE